MTANCHKILQGLFDRRQSKISRRHLTELLAAWF